MDVSEAVEAAVRQVKADLPKMARGRVTEIDTTVSPNTVKIDGVSMPYNVDLTPSVGQVLYYWQDDDNSVAIMAVAT